MDVSSMRMPIQFAKAIYSYKKPIEFGNRHNLAHRHVLDVIH